MNACHKGLLPFAATALIGLVGTSSALAKTPPQSGPPQFSCKARRALHKDLNGTRDNFAATGTVDPKPHPSAGHTSSQGLNATTNIYDQTASDYRFGETFQLPAGPVTKIRVTTQLKPLAGTTRQ